MRQKVIRGGFMIICVLAAVLTASVTAGAAGEPSDLPTPTPTPLPLPGTGYATPTPPATQTGGWLDIGGKRYYFLPVTWEKASGWQDIGGRRYYFLPETNEMVRGWQSIGDAIYYFSPDTGEMLQGWQKIDNIFYYFNEQGVLSPTSSVNDPVTGQASGWIREGNGKTYYRENGRLASGWKKISGYTYYFLPSNNQMVVGLCKIKKTYYIFRNNGRLAKSGGTSIVRAGGHVYCAGRSGKAASGWLIKNNKLYYAGKNGKAKTSTTYQGITFTGTGAAKSNVNSKLKIKLIRTVKSITNSKMSKKKKLQKCWSYVTGGKFRYASKYPNLRASGWQKTTAYNMLSTRTGNCYSYACAFAALASEIGYKPYVICGKVPGSRDRSPSGFTRHAWVRINGRYYDPEAQYAGWRRGIYGTRWYPVSHRIQKIVRYSK